LIIKKKEIRQGKEAGGEGIGSRIIGVDMSVNFSVCLGVK